MQEEKSQETKTRLFHILAEGQYNPQYWLHFEMSASEDLWALDNFLKKMWVDDLDYLSRAFGQLARFASVEWDYAASGGSVRNAGRPILDKRRE